MAKPVTVLVVFFVALNLLSGMLIATGVDEVVGLDAKVGSDDAVEQRTQNQNVSGGTGTGETLTSIRNVLANQWSSFIGVIFPGLEMLERLGVPTYITDYFLGGMFSIMTTIAIIRFFREGTL